MSTRSTTHFRSGGKTEAIVYRHSDGYPDGAGVDLRKFLEDCSVLPDPRFTDPSYLAAKYVVWLAKLFAVEYKWTPDNKLYQVPKTNPLDFLSVGVMLEDPGDIEYRYYVDCDHGKFVNGKPPLTCVEVDGYGGLADGPEHPIPQLEVE